MTTTAASQAAEHAHVPRVPRRPRVVRRLLAGARTRILAVVLMLLAFSTVASTLALREILFSRVDQRVESSLAQEVTEFRGFAAQARDPSTGRRVGDRTRRLFDLFLARDVPDQGEATFTFVDGRPYRSNADPGTSRELLTRVRALGAVPTVTRGDVDTPAGRIRYLAVPITTGTQRRGTFVATAAIGEERAEVTQAVRAAAGVSAAVLAVAAVLAFLAVGRVLAPLRDLGATARAIGSGDELTRRIPVDGHDEIAELARSFNAMLDRLEQAFSSQRALVSDAGHELRTPITIMRGHLELLADDPERRRASIEIVADELDRMSRLVEDLLLLAKSERPDFLDRRPLDLDLLTDELATKAHALGDRAWTVEARALGTVTADRQRLTQAVANLARNAVEHTGPGGRIALGSALEDGWARLWVSDDGPGVPEADRRRIFDRFARGSRPGTDDGHGLGLAIVRAVAEAHGGRAELVDRPGRGATFAIILPAEPA